MSIPSFYFSGHIASFLSSFHLILEHLSLPFPLVFEGVVSALFAVLLLWPKQRRQVVETKERAWEMAARMVMATCFVLGLTSTASLLGPHLSGLLSPLPIFATVFAVFSHQFQGARAARQVLHGVVISSFACAVFFLFVACLIKQWSMLCTFRGATLSALLTQGCTLWLLRPHTLSAQRKADQEDDCRNGV
jgi:hypothetical protein